MPFKDVTDIILNEEVKEIENNYDSDPEVREALDLFRAECKLRRELTEARKKRNITQKDIQEKSGLTQQMISRIERDSETSPNLKSLLRYIIALGYKITLEPNEETNRVK